MQAHELFRYFRMPELADFRQYVRTLPTNTLMGFGAFAALTTFWYATRPKALKPPCDLSMQSVEVPVSGGAGLPAVCIFSAFLQVPRRVLCWSTSVTGRYLLARALCKPKCAQHTKLAGGVIDGGKGQNTGQRDKVGGVGGVSPSSHPEAHCKSPTQF